MSVVSSMIQGGCVPDPGLLATATVYYGAYYSVKYSYLGCKFIYDSLQDVPLEEAVIDAVKTVAEPIIEATAKPLQEMGQSVAEHFVTNEVVNHQISNVGSKSMTIVLGVVALGSLGAYLKNVKSNPTSTDANLFEPIMEESVSKLFADSILLELEKLHASKDPSEASTSSQITSEELLWIEEKALEILQEKLGFNIEEKIDEAISNQEKLIDAEIQRLKDEIADINKNHKKLKDQFKPIRAKFQKELAELEEIKILENLPQVRAFYKTLHNFLSSKFFSSIVLNSGEIQRAANKKQTATTAAASYAAESLTFFVGGLITLATFGAAAPIVVAASVAVASAIGKVTEEAVERCFDKHHEKLHTKRRQIAGNARDAMILSELLSRKITQKLIKKIQKFSPEVSEIKAKQSGEEIISYLSSKELDVSQFTTFEDVIQTLVKVVNLEDDPHKKRKGRCSIL